MLKVLAFTLGASLALPAAAQITSMQASNPLPKGGGDPNRKICERMEKIGTRLSTVTVCMTAREWKDQRLGQRQDLEKVQQNVNQNPSN